MASKFSKLLFAARRVFINPNLQTGLRSSFFSTRTRIPPPKRSPPLFRTSTKRIPPRERAATLSDLNRNFIMWIVLPTISGDLGSLLGSWSVKREMEKKKKEEKMKG